MLLAKSNWNHGAINCRSCRILQSLILANHDLEAMHSLPSPRDIPWQQIPAISSSRAQQHCHACSVIRRPPEQRAVLPSQQPHHLKQKAHKLLAPSNTQQVAHLYHLHAHVLIMAGSAVRTLQVKETDGVEINPPKYFRS
jgi:hypothetical protein